MFTGIITHLGRVQEKTEQSLCVHVPHDLLSALRPHASIAVDGVCLTITRLIKHGFCADIMPETYRRTALGELTKNRLVNLELPLAASGRFDGHIVQGHVDGTGTIVSIVPDGNSRIFTIHVDPALSDFCVEKGSITVNGISLTIITTDSTFFTVGIIPYTWEHTMLKETQIGQRVNIEGDIIAKYISRLATRYMKKRSSE